jgi:predicted nuclease of predicted toxin-antitoxin system
MKLLFDQNISFRIVNKLYGQFKDCKHVFDVGLLDSEDSDIWLFAKKMVLQLLLLILIFNKLA